ncbi:acyl-CoA-binding protein, putative [Eimeria maxima]|uniref:Acyl-CoA-binding protein, putative n=1 Tax=Eimeria maxima TaxID=5804 RepID=U6M404_EIMMA|nr:acyl-CoA-binding protein, putative [Eimeria maxima]CDJ57798.1 acyl-CoA-binding protein, putative [Eimeria maxima]
MLLACGAKVNTQDDWGETPLHAAIAAEQQELVTMLVEAGTDTSLKNNEGKSCADLMIEEGHRDKSPCREYPRTRNMCSLPSVAWCCGDQPD